MKTKAEARYEGVRRYWADLHLGHPPVSNMRGYGSTKAHDEAVCSAWEKTVRPGENVYVLGDIVGRSSHTEHALALLADLPGTKHLIAGNHDPVASMHRNGWKHQRRFLEVFASVRDFARVSVSRRTLLLSHYPYLGEGDDHTDEARYAQYRLPDCGEFLLHGHTHKAEQKVHGEGGRQIHVGVDAWPDGPIAEVTVTRALGLTK